MKFEWDKRKNQINRQKHGITFEEAETVFYDDDALLKYDDGHSDDEDRFVLLGMSKLEKILIVCHCYRAGEQVIRIISARRATNRERIQYEERQ